MKQFLRMNAAASRRRLTACIVIIAAILVSTVLSADELRCHICGEVIPPQAGYFKVKDSKEVFCERCFNTAQRCVVCKLPKAAEELDPDSGICQKCLAKLPRCKSCGKAIVGTAYTFPFAKATYCAECKNRYPACYICGVPAGPRYWKYPDGRIVCDDCGERAVFDIGEIERIMRDAQAIVETRLGLRLNTPYQLKVEKLEDLRISESERRDKAAFGHSPLYGRELGLYRRTGEKSEIYLLFGLPAELVYEAAAHEYAHAWQAENGSQDLSPELREGFAQWVAADVLRVKDFKSALEKLELRSDMPYGTGYRRLRDLSPSTIFRLQRNGR